MPIKITGQSAAPTVTGSDAGTLYYDSTAKVLKVYNGASWENLSQDDKIRQDVTTLALRQAIGDNHIAYNLPNSFVDQFEDDSGVGSATNAAVQTTTALWEPAAYIVENREIAGDHKVVVTSTVTWVPDTPIHLFEGNAYSQLQANSTYPNTSPADDAAFLTIDLWGGGSGPYTNAVVGYKFFGDNTSVSQSPVGKVQGSHDESSNYVDLTADIHDFLQVPTPLSHQEVNWSNDIAYRYIKFVKTGGTISNTGWWHEIQLKEKAPRPLEWAGTVSSATGTIIGNANVPTTAQTRVSGVMLYKDAGSGSSTIGTDLEIYFTCNGGTNWTEAASYTEVTPVFSTGIKMVKLGETTCTSGSDIRYKVVWANQDDSALKTQLHGIGINY